MKIPKLTAAAAFMLIITALPARGQSLTGQWTAEYPARIQNLNGVQTAEKGEALVTFEQKGDSIFGSWQALGANVPAAAVARTLAGTFKNGKLDFRASPTEARIRYGGDETSESKVMMTTFYEATVTGDVIEGTMFSQSEDGAIRSQPLKWSAKRSTETQRN